MMKRRSLLAVAGMLLTGFTVSSAPAHADALADITARGTIRIGVPQDYPPFGSVGTDMNLKGLDIDMATMIGEKMGAKVEFVPVTLPNRIPYLQTNKVDLIISSLGKNAEREKAVDFTQAYAPFFNGVFAPKDVKIEKPEDLSGKTIAVTRGAIEDFALSKIAPPDADIKRFEDNNGTMSAFLAGQTEVIVTGNVHAAAILEKNPPKRPELKFLMNKSPCYIGLNKNEAGLKDKVNAIISEAKKDGTLAGFIDKWLHQELPADL